MTTLTTGSGLLKRILSTGTVETADGQTIKLHSNVSPKEGEFLQRVIRQVRPKRSLEVGLAYGISTLYICEALAEVGAERHVAIDPHQFGLPEDERRRFSTFSGWQGIGVENVRRAGYAHLVQHIPESSDVALPRMAAEGQQFDFAFIDGYHTFEAAFVDFYYVDKMIPVGGVIAFDDLTYPSIRKMMRFVIRNRDYSPVYADAPSRPLAKSWKLRLAEPLLRSRLKPEITIPDWQLGIGSVYIAIRKNSLLPNGDVIGTRRWDAHEEF